MIFVGGRDLGEPAPTRKECLRNLNSLVCPALSGFFEAEETIKKRKLKPP
jgi:hypothetical protein